jgi:hypothetical protein
MSEAVTTGDNLEIESAFLSCISGDNRERGRTSHSNHGGFVGLGRDYKQASEFLRSPASFFPGNSCENIVCSSICCLGYRLLIVSAIGIKF